MRVIAHRGIGLAEKVVAARRGGTAVLAAILLVILLAAAQLWFGQATADTCAAFEDFPCGP